MNDTPSPNNTQREREREMKMWHVELWQAAFEKNFTCCTHKIKFYFIHFSFS